MDTSAVIAVIGGAVYLTVSAGLLVDLGRVEVRHLPKWAWALIIVLLSFPVGAIVYLVVGRVPAAARTAPTEDGAQVTSSPPPIEIQPPPDAPPAPAHRPDARPVITTRALTKIYGGTVALDAVDLVVPRGGTYGLIGPNGAGKTTMRSILSDLRRPTSGSSELAVERTRLGVLPDTPRVDVRSST